MPRTLHRLSLFKIRTIKKPGLFADGGGLYLQVKEGIDRIGDLQPGMLLEGVVTNVANFGAFVDVGVHQDGLVHVSAMAYRFVSDPHEVVRSGQVVRVKVVDVDVELVFPGCRACCCAGFHQRQR